jgi:hypothetical protein
VYLHVSGLPAGCRGICLEFSSCASPKGDDVGKQARIALLLAGTACLMAAMFEWIVSELQ